MDECRICIIEPLEQDAKAVGAARKTKARLLFSSCGNEYLKDPAFTTFFIVKDFEGPIFDNLCKNRAKILGPTALIQLAEDDDKLPLLELRRPLHNRAMRGATVCFTGYRTQSDYMNRISRLVYHMGGRVRREMDINTTHLIAHHPGGEKFEYADTFKIPILSDTWVTKAWEQRFQVGFNATSPEIVTQYKLKLGGTRICFFGFTPERTQKYKEYVANNNGQVAEIDDPLCTHLVVNDNEDPLPALPETIPSGCCVVKSEWFWKTMETEICPDVKEFLLQDLVTQTPDNGHTGTPGSAASRARKRKRLQQRPRCSDSPATGKRRSSANTLDFSGNFLDWTLTPDKSGHDNLEDPKSISPRQAKFFELVNTESNYVEILKVIVNTFKIPLEEETPLLDAMELKMIFGNLPPIVDVHSAMLEELKAGLKAWSPSFSIGKIILNKASDLQKAYPPFINYFEKSKETIEKCENDNPRFHGFLQSRQKKPECGRQTLKELLIRPVQRLPSVSLLLADLLKHTEKNHPDHGPLEKALAAVKEVMTHINEDKRRTEAQVAMFDLFNDIENCPPGLISSHRVLIAKCECLDMTDGRKGDQVTLLLFTDTIEICCKRRAKAFATLRGTKNLQKLAKTKQLKHVRLIELSNVNRVVDILDADECKNSFALRLQDDELRFALTDENVSKSDFLDILLKQKAVNSCTTDPDCFLEVVDISEIGAEPTSKGPSHSLTKALKFASNARVKMGRALSLSRTPSRASRISRRAPNSALPSPAISRLADMRIQSAVNLNDSCVSLESVNFGI